MPMIFCHRFDWGGELGENGGVWISPRLIQLGIEETSLSMMYLLSQGKVEGLETENTYWGYDKLTVRDPSAQMCYAYEAVPACLDLDYEPGGSLSWTTTQTSNGPNLYGDAAFSTAADCVKLVITFTSVIEVNGSANIVSGYSNFATLYEIPYQPTLTIGSLDQGGQTIVTAGTQQPCTQGLWNQQPTSYGSKLNTDGGGSNINTGDGGSSSGPGAPGTGPTDIRQYEFDKLHLAASWNQPSEVRYDWRVKDAATLQVVKSGTLWIKSGTQSLTIDDLPQGQYLLEFDGLYKERDKAVSVYNVPDPGQDACLWNSYWAAARSARSKVPSSGFVRHTNVGSETQSITTTITQTILNVIEFPDLPGGDQQIVGGLSDLTMLGISGDITALRPQDGPDYFIQSHIFVEQGVQVERLTLGGVDSSPFYGDLVNYLLQQTKVLKDDQIDEKV